ncbi:MAG TPA: hypothetical protein ENN18_10215 [Proteobacteria bacterium]|nr:hypothetical protein [Pseudomonadota bacterium]
MRKDLHYLKRFLAVIVGLVLSIVIILPAMAEEDRPSADLSVSILSDYIWRGQELSRDSIVIQPSMTVGYKGFSANLWGNLDTDPYVSAGNSPANWNETDLTLSYGRDFGPLNISGGYIYYGLDGVDDSQEVFLSLGVDTLLSPSLTVYKEIDSYMHWYFLLGISHSFKITEAVSLDLVASASYLKSEDVDEYPEINDQGVATGAKFNNFHDGVISASLPISVAKYVTITPSLSYTFPLSSDASDEMKYRSKTGEDDNFVYGGVTLSLAF